MPGFEGRDPRLEPDGTILGARASDLVCMTLVFYITGHGFGHATRSLAIIERILTLRPDTRVVVRSSVPEWFLRQSGPAGIESQATTTDTGIVQIDGLALDDEASARRAAEFYSTFDERISREAATLAALGAGIVVGDVPPLAFPAAARAGIPSVASANFTWDWIYEYYPRFESIAPGVIDTMQRAYSEATLALRMPFPGGFQSMLGVTRDIPLVARRSRHGRQRVKEMLQLPFDQPVVLASFGGHSTAVPYVEIAMRSRFTLLLTTWESATGDTPDNLRRLSGETLATLDLRYEDLVAAADVVVSKPGYGIVSECIANETALLYTSRGAFAEKDVMVPEMGRFMRCRYIEQEQLRAGDWQASVDALIAQPAPAERMALDGADIAARTILGLVGK